jgi:hypothetical protein
MKNCPVAAQELDLFLRLPSPTAWPADARAPSVTERGLPRREHRFAQCPKSFINSRPDGQGSYSRRMTSIKSSQREDLNPVNPSAPHPARIPFAVKLAFTAFMAVLVPVYWTKYGPANFLYFCDLALFLTLAAVWLENRLLASMAAVGILLPQIVLWCGDFAAHLIGVKFIGMTDYMFDAHHSLFLRSLSLFHGWLPFLLWFLVARLGYDRRALFAWTAVAWSAILISFFFLPAPGAKLANPLAAVNVDYVYGFSDTVAQTWLPGWAWLVFLMAALPVVIYLPTHCWLRKYAADKNASAC